VERAAGLAVAAHFAAGEHAHVYRGFYCEHVRAPPPAGQVSAAPSGDAAGS
jgi:hypothetical protein